MKRYFTEPCPSPEEALNFIRKFPQRYYMEGGLVGSAEADTFWLRRINALDEPLYFVKDRLTRNAIVCIDRKEAAEQRAVIYEAVAEAIGQA